MAASMPKLMRAETDNAQCDGSLGNISVMIDHADFSIVIKEQGAHRSDGNKVPPAAVALQYCALWCCPNSEPSG
jgi:hypothetical protein